jgi:hypothetical protein
VADRALRANLHVLVAAVTAAERGEPMPPNTELHARIGGAPNGPAMALLHLERAGIIERHGRGRTRRVVIKATGASTG